LQGACRARAARNRVFRAVEPSAERSTHRTALDDLFEQSNNRVANGGRGRDVFRSNSLAVANLTM